MQLLQSAQFINCSEIFLNDMIHCICVPHRSCRQITHTVFFLLNCFEFDRVNTIRMTCRKNEIQTEELLNKRRNKKWILLCAMLRPNAQPSLLSTKIAMIASRRQRTLLSCQREHDRPLSFMHFHWLSPSCSFYVNAISHPLAHTRAHTLLFLLFRTLKTG